MNKDNPVFALPAILFSIRAIVANVFLLESMGHGPGAGHFRFLCADRGFAGINQEGQGVGEEPAEYSRDLTVE